MFISIDIFEFTMSVKAIPLKLTYPNILNKRQPEKNPLHAPVKPLTRVVYI